MRIIRGIYGRRRFQAPSSFSARPTTDFAKENLFNVLENLIEWKELDALDLFSGTGSIAFEMLSRGCRSVTAVESNALHAAFITKVAKELKAEPFNLVKNDVFRFLRTAKQSFDLIFADPPYAMKALLQLPNLILNSGLLRDNGLFILEHSKEYVFSSHPLFSQQRVYGAVNFSIFLKATAKTTA
ncbi:MAG: RsmD family RNA methyltransferase [Tannerella sp.]|jgi:16S rRNA (guanine(966)-N(2))-methyltransferase RsmD|nr:RsmD family RNA methyltransferase [Tannerella sp.]